MKGRKNEQRKDKGRTKKGRKYGRMNKGRKKTKEGRNYGQTNE